MVNGCGHLLGRLMLKLDSLRVPRRGSSGGIQSRASTRVQGEHNGPGGGPMLEPSGKEVT
jgi:hypothetical protein